MVSTTRVSNANMMNFGEKLSRFSWSLFIPMCVILILSLVVLFSAGGGSWFPFAMSQLLKIIFCMVIFFVVSFSNIKFWIKSAYIWYAIALILIVLVTFVGNVGMGAQRWLSLKFINIQPSEFIKIALVLALARYFAWKNSVELSQFKNYLIPILMLIVPFVFIFLQPDLGTGISLVLITIGMFYIVGANKKWFLIAFILTLLAAPAVWYGAMHNYQRDRIITFLNPEKDSKGAEYQINQAKIAFGSGGILGKGAGNSKLKLNHLPEKHTDYIFAIIGEEYGLFGTLVIVILFMLNVKVILSIYKKCKDDFGKYLSFGIMLIIALQSIINMGMTIGILPAKGFPLPFVSYGGSSMLINFYMLGILTNISRNNFKTNKISV